MIFASEALSQQEVDAVLSGDWAPNMFIKAHDNFIRAVIQTSEKARRLVDDLEGCERDGKLYLAFRKAAIAPKMYAIGGNSKPVDVFGNETPEGFNFAYWLDMCDNVKDAAEAFLTDVGMKNGGRLPTPASVEFMMQLADLGICAARLYRGYIDVRDADDYCRRYAAQKKAAAKTDEEFEFAVGKERYADRMMTGVVRMLHYNTGLPGEDGARMAEDMAAEKRRFAELDAAGEEARGLVYFKEYGRD